jgi:hypothetical protein
MELGIEFTPEGKIKIPWWTPEIAEIACSLCGHDGWQKFGAISPMEFLNDSKQEEFGPCFRCSTRNPWCG